MKSQARFALMFHEITLLHKNNEVAQTVILMQALCCNSLITQAEPCLRHQDNMTRFIADQQLCAGSFTEKSMQRFFFLTSFSVCSCDFFMTPQMRHLKLAFNVQYFAVLYYSTKLHIFTMCQHISCSLCVKRFHIHNVSNMPCSQCVNIFHFHYVSKESIFTMCQTCNVHNVSTYSMFIMYQNIPCSQCVSR